MHAPKRPNDHAGQKHLSSDHGKIKKKKVQPTRSYWLRVLLNKAKDFDVQHPPPERWTRLHGGYRVNIWLSPEEVYRSKIKKKNEDGDAVWGEVFEMLVDAPAVGEMMIRVELERVGVVEEPGSSTPRRVVGRARYRLARLNKKRDVVSSLCLCDGGYGGTIHFSASLKPVFLVE